MSDKRETYIAQANVLNHRRIYLRLHDDFFQKLVHYPVQRGVFQASLASLCEGRPDCERNDHIVGGFRGAFCLVSICCPLGGSHPSSSIAVERGESLTQGGIATHMAARPLFVGVRCERIELSRSAIVEEVLVEKKV